MAEPLALLAGGRSFALPPGARVVPAQMLRPAPLGPAGMLGIAMLGGQGLPVMAAAAGLPGGPAWVLLAEGLVVAGEAFAEALPAGALPLIAPRPVARPLPSALPAAEGAGWVVPAGGGRGRIAALALELGGLRLVLPFAAMERIIDNPPLGAAPRAGAQAGRLARGYALQGGAPVLVLDPAELAGQPGDGAEAPLLAVFRHAGQRLGLPFARIGPARPGEPSITARLDALRAGLAAAPLARMAPPPEAEPTRGLLLCSAGGVAFALEVEAVVAVIPPVAPTPTARAAGGLCGVVAHRGDVLPVLDGGLQLGGDPVLGAPGAAAPMLRLNLERPVAVAVSRVTGLRQVPLRLLSATGGAGLVAAIAALAEGPLPVCRASLLGAALVQPT